MVMARRVGRVRGTAGQAHPQGERDPISHSPVGARRCLPRRQDDPVAVTADLAPDLTRRQRQVLAALRRLHERDGVPPTLREIGAEVGLSSASSVVAHVRVLEERGLAERAPGCPRTLRVTRERTSHA
jgi:hypothetical protein